MDTTDLTTNMNPDAEVSAIPPTTGTSSLNVGDSERIISTIGGAALDMTAERQGVEGDDAAATALKTLAMNGSYG